MWRVLICFVIPFVAAVLRVAPVFSEPMVQFTVVPGDTLIKCCREHLKDERKWPKIARINRLNNPDLIYPGQVLHLPASMLKGLPMDGVTTLVQGDVLILSDENRGWTPLIPGMAVKEKNRIKTGLNGMAEVVFKTGSTIFLRQDTEIGLKSIRDQGSVVFLNNFVLKAGKVVTTVRTGTGRRQRLRMETPTAVAAVRGTEFRSGLEADQTSRFEVLDGTVVVRARDRTVTVGPGEGTVVKHAQAPTEPKRLLGPPRPFAPQNTYRRLPLSLSYEHDPGTTAYRVAVSLDQEGRKILGETTLSREAPFVLKAQPDGTYYVRATGFDGDGFEGMPSPWLPITIRINPVAPIIETPLDKAEYRGNEVEIRWMKVKDAASSHLQVSKTADFSSLLIDLPGVDGTVYRAKLPGCGTYWVRICSVASDGFQGDWTDPVGFTLSTLPPPPSLQRPVAGKNEISMGWQNAGSGISYRVQISGDEGFNMVLEERTVTDSHVIMSRPKARGTYFARIAGIDEKGFQGDFSPPQAFEVSGGFCFPELIPFGATLLILLLIL